MSPADRPGRPAGAEEGTAVNGSGQGAAAAPPWQRATSQMRDEPGQYADESYVYRSGNGYSEGEQPTMVQPLASDPGEQLFAGNSGRTAVNLTGSGSGPGAGSATGSGGESRGRASGTPSALRRPGRGPRRASLQVKRVDPWSVLKLAFVLAIAFFLVLMVVVGVLYAVLDGMGVWDKVNGTYSDLVSGGNGGGGAPLISVGRVFGVTAVVGVINVILFTALATVGAFVYNVSADLAGGLEVTLAERE